MTFLRRFLKDLALLKLPVTAASVVALFLAVAQPFGINPSAEALTGALVGIGALAAYLNHLLNDRDA